MSNQTAWLGMVYFRLLFAFSTCIIVLYHFYFHFVPPVLFTSGPSALFHVCSPLDSSPRNSCRKHSVAAGEWWSSLWSCLAWYGRSSGNLLCGGKFSSALFDLINLFLVLYTNKNIWLNSWRCLQVKLCHRKWVLTEQQANMLSNLSLCGLTRYNRLLC